MDQNQTTSQIFPPVPPKPGIFGTNIPSTVAFAVAVLLFLLPFAEIKCGGSVLAKNSGLGIALKKQWKSADMFGSKELTKSTTKQESKEELGQSSLFAMIAMGVGALGLLLSFAGSKVGGGAGIVAGVVSAGGLIAMMVTMKSEFNQKMINDAANKTKEASDVMEMDKLGNSLDSMKPVLSFTPWFYIAVIAFLVAAFFCYKRMQSPRT
jgi:hypothetical protein